MKLPVSLIVAAAAMCSAITIAGGHAHADPPPAEPSTPPTPPAPPTPLVTMDHDGAFTVGTDVLPGVYTSAGPIENNGPCYWKRMGGAQGEAIIDNAFTKKPQVVLIEPTDAVFVTDGCQPWFMTDELSPPGDTPLWLAPLQLRHYLNMLNGYAGESGHGQLPPD